MNTKKLKIMFSYMEDVVPPRCRNPRPTRFHDGELTVNIPDLTSVETPAAILMKGFHGFGDDAPSFAVAYHLHNKKLWTSTRIWNAHPLSYTSGGTDYEHHQLPDVIDVRTDDVYPSFNHFGFMYYPSKGREKIIKGLREAAKNNIFIDGVRHCTAGEPRYVVQTFGLGNNHGGTATFATDEYNPNIKKECYFNLNQLDDALAYATWMAESRGDMNSIPMKLNNRTTFEILIPEAVQIKPTSIVVEDMTAPGV